MTYSQIDSVKLTISFSFFSPLDFLQFLFIFTLIAFVESVNQVLSTGDVKPSDAWTFSISISRLNRADRERMHTIRGWHTEIRRFPSPRRRYISVELKIINELMGLGEWSLFVWLQQCSHAAVRWHLKTLRGISKISIAGHVITSTRALEPLFFSELDVCRFFVSTRQRFVLL